MSEYSKIAPITDLPTAILDTYRAMERRWATEAAARRGVTLDPDSVTAGDLERWGAVALEDSIAEERRKAEAEALRRQNDLNAALRPILPEEFAWVDPRAPGLLYERIADAKNALAAARAAADALASGEVLRVLLVGPAGSGKSSLAALIPQVMAARWARDRYEREVAALDQRPIAEIVAERMAARREAERDLTARPSSPVALAPRSRRAPDAPPAPSALAKTLARVMVGGAVSAHWTTAHKLFKLAKKPQGFREADPLEEATEARLLVLDDIGGEPTQANVAPVEDVLRERHDAQRITIATTGMFDPEADPRNRDALLAPLSARYGAAVVRRLAEDGRAIVIPLAARAASTRAA